MNIDFEFEDVVFFVGLILTSTGLWMFSPALSLTVAGVIFMAFSFVLAGGDDG